jgi:hypothetical protein
VARRPRRSESARRPRPVKGGGLPEPVRGLVLLLSLLLWSPVLRALLAGEMDVDEAVLRYAAALLVSWGGCAVLVGVVRTYTPDPPDEPPPADPDAGCETGTTAAGRAATTNGTSTGSTDTTGTAGTGTGTAPGAEVDPVPADTELPQRRVSDRAE